MRFSIVFDENGTVLDASADVEETDKPMPGPSVSRRYLDVPDDVPEAQLNQIVERMLADQDAGKPGQAHGRGEADENEST